MYGGEVDERSPISPLLSFFFFLTVTFSNRIEFRCKVEGEVGVEAEKIESDFCKMGSEKEGEEVGL